MIRIGVCNIDVSHPKAFTEILHKGDRARYVAIYNDGFRGDDEVDGFIKSAGLEKRCASMEELMACCDIGFVQDCNWDKHIGHAEPFLRAHKPVFIDKPVVGNVRDMAKLRRYIADGAVVVGSSSLRYAYDVQKFNALSPEERGEIISVYCTCGVDEFNYAIHTTEMIGGVLQGAVSCAFLGSTDAAGKHAETYRVLYKSGATAVYTITHGVWQPCYMTVMTTKGTRVLDGTGAYAPMLDNICTFMETGDRKKAGLADMEEVFEAVLIMLAGRISREQGGGYVRLDEIPADDPGFDGYEFEKGYAAAAKKIYLA
ncbi:MAG: hypothetical protein VB111_04460 [Clostridiaceae bacterium]|nr:hypothetical protein [Clostridiaceae bacterium]